MCLEVRVLFRLFVLAIICLRDLVRGILPYLGSQEWTNDRPGAHSPSLPLSLSPSLLCSYTCVNISRNKIAPSNEYACSLAGKTIVARLFAKVLHEIGMRRTNTCIETSGHCLVLHGAIKADATIQSAMDGVLFIDEADSLDPKRNREGLFIVTKLLKAAEDHRDRITIILAGLVSLSCFSYAVTFEDVSFWGRRHSVLSLKRFYCLTRKSKPLGTHQHLKKNRVPLNKSI